LALPKIIGKSFKQARESLGLSVEDLAKKATFSKRQVQQIEEGGYSAFYSPAIQFQSAKKMAMILGLSHEDAFQIAKADLEPLNLPQLHLNASVQKEAKLGLLAIHKLSPLYFPSKNTGNAHKLSVWILGAFLVAAMISGGWVLFAPSLEAGSAAFMAQAQEAPAVIEEEIQGESATTVAPQEQRSTPAEIPLKNTSLAVCGYVTSSATPILEYLTPKPSKAGNQVYVINKGDAQTICFEDAHAIERQVVVARNAGFNFMGKPPLKIFSKNLSQFDLYYQGYKVKLNELGPVILLQEAQIQ